MEFATPAQRTCYEQVGAFLRQVYGERLVSDAGQPAYGLREGSAWVNIRVGVDPGGAPVVAIRAWLVSGTDLTPEFLYHLVAEASRPPVGAYGLDAQGDLFLEHVLPGEGLTLAQLRQSVDGIAGEADRADDAIVARFGGIRMTDKRV